MWNLWLSSYFLCMFQVYGNQYIMKQSFGDRSKSSCSAQPQWTFWTVRYMQCFCSFFSAVIPTDTVSVSSQREITSDNTVLWKVDKMRGLSNENEFEMSPQQQLGVKTWNWQMYYRGGLQRAFHSNFLFFTEVISTGKCQTANDKAGHDRFMIWSKTNCLVYIHLMTDFKYKNK